MPARPGLATRAAVMAACVVLATGARAMWVALTDAELQASPVIVEGTWAGEAPVAGRSDGARAGTITVTRVWKGPVGLREVRVVRPPTGRPIASDDLVFRTGDRGLWFLKAEPAADAAAPYRVDHPQRFVGNDAANATALRAWRERLGR